MRSDANDERRRCRHTTVGPRKIVEDRIEDAENFITKESIVKCRMSKKDFLVS